MATQEDRSLSAGVSLPKWMKSRMTDKFDFDQSAFSPTELDDSFMYYYRNPINRLQQQNDTTQSATTTIVAASGATDKSNVKVDVSKHLPPCQKFLNNSNDISFTQQMKTPNEKVKSNGVDDGFHSEAAKCGTSIIKVAHQMVSGKVTHGFTLKTDNRCPDDEDIQFQQQLAQYNLQKRRGSKSLPASPLSSPKGSPKSKRKGVNKYFTGAFTVVDAEKHKGGWILSNLLARRDISQSMSLIGEETRDELERVKSASTMSIDGDAALMNMNNNNAPKAGASQVYKAKASELREMNFWSPTSM